MNDTPEPVPISPGEILDYILDPNEEKTPVEWVCADTIIAIRAEVERLRAALIHARNQMQHPDQLIDEALAQPAPQKEVKP